MQTLVPDYINYPQIVYKIILLHVAPRKFWGTEMQHNLLLLKQCKKPLQQRVWFDAWGKFQQKSSKYLCKWKFSVEEKKKLEERANHTCEVSTREHVAWSCFAITYVIYLLLLSYRISKHTERSYWAFFVLVSMFFLYNCSACKFFCAECSFLCFLSFR